MNWCSIWTSWVQLQLKRTYVTELR